MNGSLIVYGSLLNPNELSTDFLSCVVTPIKVKGYKRIFNQMPSWRKGQGKECAVLRVERSKSDWFNAVSITLPKHFDITELATREIGYDLVDVSIQTISAYSDTLITTPFHLFIDKAEKKNNQILPNRAYLT